MRCKQCRVAMVELKDDIYHGKRKFRCPLCQRAKMKKRSKKKARTDEERVSEF